MHGFNYCLIESIKKTIKFGIKLLQKNNYKELFLFLYSYNSLFINYLINFYDNY